MRLAAYLIALVSILSGADSPYLKLNQTTKDGVVQLTAENISGKPIIAYVVAMEQRKDGARRATVQSGVYTGKQELAAGATVGLANLDTRIISGELKVFVDYVRLADGTAWGYPVTAAGKGIAARFKK